MFNKWKALLAATILTMPLLSVQAGPILFTDEAAFLANIGGVADITEDFNSYTTDQSFRNGSFDLGTFTLSSSGSAQNQNSQNAIDASPFAFNGASNIDSSSFAHFFLSGGVTTATITFNEAISSFGATFRELSDSTSIGFTTTSGAKSITPGIGLGVAFFGFTLDPGEFITSFTFSRASRGDGFGMDNVMLQNATSTPGPGSIPEPSSIALLILALLAFISVKRKAL